MRKNQILAVLFAALIALATIITKPVSAQDEDRSYTLEYYSEYERVFIQYVCSEADWVDPEQVLKIATTDDLKDRSYEPDWQLTMCSGASAEMPSELVRVQIPGDAVLVLSQTASNADWKTEGRWFYLEGYRPEELEPTIPTEGLPEITESRPNPTLPMGASHTGVTGTVRYQGELAPGLVAVAFGWAVDGQDGVVMKAFTNSVDTEVTDGGILVTMAGLANSTYCWKVQQHVDGGYPPAHSHPQDWGAPTCSSTDRNIEFSGPERVETGAGQRITHWGFLPEGMTLKAEGYRVNGTSSPVTIEGPQYYAVVVFDGVVEVSQKTWEVYLPAVLSE